MGRLDFLKSAIKIPAGVSLHCSETIFQTQIFYLTYSTALIGARFIFISDK
jgi:hypothetical protein